MRRCAIGAGLRGIASVGIVLVGMVEGALGQAAVQGVTGEQIQHMTVGELDQLYRSAGPGVQPRGKVRGFTIVSPAGIQKVGYAHEDTEFINVFLTDETDIEKLDAEIACESYEALEDLTVIEGEALCL